MSTVTGRTPVVNHVSISLDDCGKPDALIPLPIVRTSSEVNAFTYLLNAWDVPGSSALPSSNTARLIFSPVTPCSPGTSE